MNHLGSIAAMLNVVTWLLYLKSQLQGSIRANPISWMMSMLIVLASALTTANTAENWQSSWFYLAGAIPCASAFTLSLHRSKHPIYLNRSELLALSFALFCLLSAWLKPALSATAISLYYLCTYFVLIQSLRHGQSREMPLAWGLWAVSALLELAALYTPLAPWQCFLIPGTNVLCWLAVCAVSLIENQSTSLTGALNIKAECEAAGKRKV